MVFGNKMDENGIIMGNKGRPVAVGVNLELLTRIICLVE